MNFYTPYNNRTPKSVLKQVQPSRTKQSHKYESDIHNQLMKFATREQLQMSQLAAKPIYGDFSKLPDFHEAQTMVARTKEYFVELPSHIRARFHNDPSEFVSFVGNPNNIDEAVKLGIMEKMPEQVQQQIGNLEQVIPEPIQQPQQTEQQTTQQG